MGRRTVQFNDEVLARLKGHKREGESWNGLGHRAADLLDAEAESKPDTDSPFGPRCTTCETLVQSWTIVDGNVLCLDCAGIDADAALPD